VDLAEIFRKDWTWPNLEVIRFWLCCHQANTTKNEIALVEVCSVWLPF